MMRVRLLHAVVAALALACAASAAEPDGAGVYTRYCSACHGRSARGDGTAVRSTDAT